MEFSVIRVLSLKGVSILSGDDLIESVTSTLDGLGVKYKTYPAELPNYTEIKLV